jgi:hypothetical protein
MTEDSNRKLLELSDLSQKDRIQILLSEYAALRSELMARTGFGFQIAAVGLASITWFMQQPLVGHPWYFWCVMTVILCCFLVAILVNMRDLTRAAYRLKSIEREVNSRAGEHLLVWETLSGILTSAGRARRFFSLIPPVPRSTFPALDPSYLEREKMVKNASSLSNDRTSSGL